MKKLIDKVLDKSNLDIYLYIFNFAKNNFYFCLAGIRKKYHDKGYYISRHLFAIVYEKEKLFYFDLLFYRVFGLCLMDKS